MTMTPATQPRSTAQDLSGTRNVVLVHGAWANSSSWSKVIPLLQAQGLHVVAVQMPLTSLADDVATTPPGLSELRPDQAGFLTLTAKGIVEDFAQDLPFAETQVMTATQGPTNGAALGGKITRAAWKTKPSWYVISENDRMISPDFERAMATQIKAKSVSLRSSHVPMLSHPVDVAQVIGDAANTPRKH